MSVVNAPQPHDPSKMRSSTVAPRTIARLARLAPVLLVVALSGSAFAWERFEDLPNAARVRKAQQVSAGIVRRSNTEVRFAPDGSAVAWREGDSWKSLPLPPSGEPKSLDDAPEWPAWAPPPSRFKALPPAPGAGRGMQASTAIHPDGQTIAQCRKGNVVIVKPGADDVQVTTEGTPAVRGVRFGNASWVYGEELDQNTAMWWSPDGRYLAYYRFDDSNVRDVPMLTDLTTVRPGIESLPYPKPGEPNPIAGLEIYDTETKKRVTVDVGPDTDQYVYAVRWLPDSSTLLFDRTNRRQNELDVMLADPASGKSRVLIHETQETWQENHPPITFLADGRRFIWESDRTGYRQFELWDPDSGRVATLTSGDFPVGSIVRVDEEHGTLWYTAFGSETKINPQLFVVGLDGKGQRRLTPDDRHYGSFAISNDGSWFTAVEQFVDQAPELRLFEVGEAAASPELVPAPDSAAELGAGTGSAPDSAPVCAGYVLRARDGDAWNSRGVNAPEFFTCLAADGKTPLYGILHRPSEFDPSKKYPLIIDVYGGPGIQTVHTRAATPDPRCEFGVLIARVDNRGTPGRGKAFEGATYLKLGGADIDDQAAAAKYLATLPGVDGSRIGITGHSYGGYATILALLRYPDLFKVGVAGAGVTDWRQYDTIYTERYMRTPQENAEGYDAGSAVKLAEGLEGKLLLLHGMVDDNVHATNLWALADQLQKLNRPFEMMVFPNSNHGIGGPVAAAAEGAKWSFLLEHLGVLDEARASAAGPAGDSGASGATAPRPAREKDAGAP